MAILKQVLKKVLAMSAVSLFAVTLLVLNPRSPSLISEAQACDPGAHEVCFSMCMYFCGWGQGYGECPVWDAENWCDRECSYYSGC